MRDLAAELSALEGQGLRRRRRVLESAQGPRVRMGGREALSFCSNDYLGLAADARIAEAAIESIRRDGIGAGASHLVSGHHSTHEQLELVLAEFVGMPRAVLFSSGYLANLAVVGVLAGRSSEIFADRLNHASLNDAMILTRAKCRRYAHCDLDALEALLKQSGSMDKIVMTDSVFSMDGDVAPLRELAQLCEHHGAWLVIDDAHGFGVLGTDGAGALSHFGLHGEHIAYVGTLGKAAGVAGAFVAGSALLAEMLIQRARSYIYTTASPPVLAAALLKSVELIRTEGWRRARLADLVARLRTGLKLRRWQLSASNTAIQPLIVSDNADTVRLSATLEARAILVPAIRPPTVPKGSARLRISLSAAHTDADVDTLIEALHDAQTEIA